MTIRFACPAGHSLEVDLRLAGKRVRCPECQRPVRVPEATPGEPLPGQSVDSGLPAAGPAADSLPRAKPLPRPPQAKPAGARPKRHKGGRPPPPPKVLVLPPREKAAPEAVLPPVAEPIPEAILVPEPVAEPEANAGAAKSPPASPSAGVKPKHRGRRDRRRERRASKQPLADAVVEAQPAPEAALPTPPRRRSGRLPQTVPADVYQPEPRRITTVKWLALVLGVAVLFSLLPIVVKMHWNLATAPGWARATLLLGLLQVVYIVWLLAAPDWASLWALTLVFALVAALYAVAAVIALAVPAGKPLMLGLDEVRGTAGSCWCLAVAAVMSLAAYLCARASTRWRRAWERGQSLDFSVRRAAGH